MSYASSVYIGCENIQDTLDANFETCDHMNWRQPHPFLEFLLSQSNKESLSAKVVPMPGRHRTVVLTYFQKLLRSAVLENQANPNCSSSTSRGECSTTFQLDTTENVQVDFNIGVNDLETTCKDDEYYLIKEIDRHISAIVEKTAEKTADQLVPLLGLYGQDAQGVNPGRTILTVRTRKTAATEDPYPFYSEEIARAAMVSNICNEPIIFGGQSLLSAYRQTANAGCCQNSGIDVGSILREFGQAFFYDFFVQSSLAGQNQNALVSPGSLALATYTKSGTQRQPGDINLQDGNAGSLGVVFDPQTGLPIDLQWKVDCGTLSMVFTATTKLFGLPADLYPVGDELEGVNGTGQITVTN